MRMANVPLNNMERRKFVKAARAKRSNVPQLLKRLALQQLGMDGQENKSISEEEKWEIFMKGVNGFTEDFMPNGRDVEIPTRLKTGYDKQMVFLPLTAVMSFAKLNMR